MKPLLATKAPRLIDGVEPIKEWERAESHLTHDGQREFMARMLKRIAAADKARKANADETATKVRTIRAKGKA